MLVAAVMQGKLSVMIRCQEPLTQPNQRELREAVDPTSGHIILDLSAVDFIDSSGVSALIYTRRVATKRDKLLILVGVRKEVMYVFTTTMLDRVFGFAKTVAEAEVMVTKVEGLI